jgi:hypothetical protein
VGKRTIDPSISPWPRHAASLPRCNACQTTSNRVTSRNRVTYHCAPHLRVRLASRAEPHRAAPCDHATSARTVSRRVGPRAIPNHVAIHATPDTCRIRIIPCRAASGRTVPDHVGSRHAGCSFAKPSHAEPSTALDHATPNHAGYVIVVRHTTPR